MGKCKETPAKPLSLADRLAQYFEAYSRYVYHNTASFQEAFRARQELRMAFRGVPKGTTIRYNQFTLVITDENTGDFRQVD